MLLVSFILAPILGDSLYSLPSAADSPKVAENRMFLHASEISLFVSTSRHLLLAHLNFGLEIPSKRSQIPTGGTGPIAS